MKSLFEIQRWDTRHRTNQLNLALVIEEPGDLRNSLLTLLRAHDWLVHAVSGTEEAFSILTHIPYNVIVLDSELSGMCATDFVRILRDSRQWQHICVVVIDNSESANVERHLAETEAVLVRRSMWKHDLFNFLLAYEGEPRVGNICG